MNKKDLENLICKYNNVESDMSRLHFEFGINVYGSLSENFYNKYNYIIFKLFEHMFGYDGKNLIEDYIFEQTDMTFDELCEKLNINE
jgi:hypothetical protein